MRADKNGGNWLFGMALVAVVGAGLCTAAQAAPAKGKAALAKGHHALHHRATTATAPATPIAAPAPAPLSTDQTSSADPGTPKMSDAEKLRRLDIMLLVTGLRCRDTADDFQADFESFETHHRRDLNLADRQLRLQFGGGHRGALPSNKAMDHINVEMANVYGNGHPWMGCHDLKGVVHDLASMAGSAPLLTVATQLLASPHIVAQP